MSEVIDAGATRDVVDAGGEVAENFDAPDTSASEVPAEETTEAAVEQQVAADGAAPEQQIAQPSDESYDTAETESVSMTDVTNNKTQSFWGGAFGRP